MTEHPPPPPPSLGDVREMLHEASHEPIDPGTGMLLDAVSELTDYVEQQAAKGSDARAQLWARVYSRALTDVHCMPVPGTSPSNEQLEHIEMLRRRALALAGLAVRDFDEHYLGGKR